MRLALLTLIALALALGACASEPYPLPSGPPNVDPAQPRRGRPGDRNAVLIYLEVRPGDPIELVGAEAIGTSRASVRFLVSCPVIQPDGTYVIGDEFEPLEGRSRRARRGATPATRSGSPRS